MTLLWILRQISRSAENFSLCDVMASNKKFPSRYGEDRTFIQHAFVKLQSLESNEKEMTYVELVHLVVDL
jgi:hypothetical protein